MKQWSIAKLNKENAKTISQRYGLPPVIATLLDIRGIISEEDINDFLFNESTIDDPFEIKDMDKAVNRIKYAIENGEKICVYGDFDADGVTSTALLYSYFETVGADVIYYIPDRETEGYGMNKAAIDKIKNDNVDLIVTVDNGISAVDEITYANSLGIDTVITDHHMPGDTLPDAVAVVDMFRPDCNSRFKRISGVGVAFKLVVAIEGEYADVDMLLDNYSDLVCIGTIGDVMPLIKENRVFIKRGLKNMNNSDREGMRALINASGLSDREIVAENLSFGIVPRINAAGRLGLSKYSVSLLTTDDMEEAEKIAAKLTNDNAERQKIEREILDKINILIAENPSIVRDRIIIIDGEDWHPGVVGIVSSRIKDIYGKPCIIISRNGDTCRGSGRSIDGFDIWEAVSYCSDILNHFGGHPMAIGMGLDCDKIDLFRKKINEFAAEKGEMPYDKLNIDFKLNPKILDVDIAKELTYLKPFGEGNPTPVFQLSKLIITAIKPLSNNKHLKIYFKNGNNQFSALKFFSSTLDFPYSAGDVVDIAATLEVNTYKGESLSVNIKHIKPAGVDTTVYIHSLRIFEYFFNGENVSDNELKTIIPDRNDFAVVYRFLKQSKNLSNIKLDVMISKLGSDISFGKLKVILEAMKELKLISLYEDMYRTDIKILAVNGKVNLEDADIIKKLKEVYRNG